MDLLLTTKLERALDGGDNHQVSHLISLSPEMPPPATPVQGLTIHYIPIEDFQAPTLNQIEKFLEICDDALEAGKGVAVHCRGGNGRTGTVGHCHPFIICRGGRCSCFLLFVYLEVVPKPEISKKDHTFLLKDAIFD